MYSRWSNVAIVVVASWAIVMMAYRWPRPSREVLAPRGANVQEYVGAAACAECHQETSSRQRCSRMAQTLQTADQLVRERSLPLPAVVLDEPNQVRYHINERDGKLILEAKRGRELANAEMTYALGSGKLALTFVRELDAYTYEELRVSYFAETGEWDLTPGQRPARPASAAEALGRPIEKHGEQGCLNCHVSLLVQSAGKIDDARSDFGVDCERCHGPGRDHVASVDAGPLVKPRAPELVEALRLAEGFRDGQPAETPADELLKSLAELGDERPIRDLYVCGECHGRPQIWEPPIDELLPKFPVAALVASACYQRSTTKMLCDDCHDPHGNSPADDRPYVAVCLQCHRDGTVCPKNPVDGCIECHMPVRSPIRHAHFTHHRIAIYRHFDDPHGAAGRSRPHGDELPRLRRHEPPTPSP